MDDMISVFPEIEEIADLELKKLTIKALELAFKKGGWNINNVQLAPVTVNWIGCSCNLIEHIRKVTQVCISNYEKLSNFYKINKTSLDRDIVVAGALLHDLGKFTEFTIQDGKPMHSNSAFLMRHPLSGAIIAAEAGLPEKIVHLIAVHSFEGDKSNQTAESAFVRSIDIFVFNCSVYGLEKK